MMFPYSTDNTFQDLCLDFGINCFNIMYIDTKIFKDTLNSKKYAIYPNQKYYNIINFNKDTFFYEKFNYNGNYKSFEIMTDDNFIENNDEFTQILENKNNKELKNSINKLLLKIRKCIPITIFSLLNEKILQINKDIEIFTNKFKNTNLRDMFNNYSELYDYLLNVKMLNMYNSLLNIKDKRHDNICNQIKIFREQLDVKINKFNYNFEPMFELIMGNEIYNEQMNIYTNIINNNYKYNTRLRLKNLTDETNFP